MRITVGRIARPSFLALLLAVAPAQGCVRSLDIAERIVSESNKPPERLGERKAPREQTRDKPQSPKGGFGRKRVAGKAVPNDLVAADGTRCPVSAEKFERTDVGDEVWCRWADPLNPSPM